MKRSRDSRNTRAGRAGRAGRAEGIRRLPWESDWWHRLLPIVLFAGTLAAAAMFGASSVSTWFDQNAQRAEAEHSATELDDRIAELEDQIARRASAEGVRREALCFGPDVAPGPAVYAVTGLSGCVGPPQGR